MSLAGRPGALAGRPGTRLSGRVGLQPPLLALRWVSVLTEATPNPNALKFSLADRALQVQPGMATRQFVGKDLSAPPLARRVLDLPGVEGVMLAARWLSVSKVVLLYLS